jgi:hypothetical protein
VDILVVQLAVKRDADGLEEQTRILVVRGVCLDGDVTSRYHLWGVSSHDQRGGLWAMSMHIRIVVDLDLREQGELVGCQAQADVAMAVAR